MLEGISKVREKIVLKWFELKAAGREFVKKSKS